MTDGSLMQVESILECSLLSWSILQYFQPALSDNRSWKSIFWTFLSGRLRQILLYKMIQYHNWIFITTGRLHMGINVWRLLITFANCLN